MPTPLHPSIRRRSLATVLGLGWLPALSNAAPVRDLRVVTAPDPASQRQVLAALKARFPSMVIDAEPATLDARHTPGAPVLAIGPVALKRALDADMKSPLVSVFTSSQTFRRLVGRERTNVTAIHADASPQSQLQLIATLFERRVTVGVLLSEASAYLERPLRQAAAQVGIELLIERSDPASDVVRSLNRLSGTQVLLAVPDSTLYTPDTLRAVLESTYRRGLPVIGFSSATVVAGTLATAYPAIDDVVADLTDLLEAWSPGAALPEARFARYWRVSVNDNVARSLGIAITDKVLNLGNLPATSAGRPG